LVLFYVH